jgi:thiol-disulfide isomerase/thioredoxin
MKKACFSIIAAIAFPAFAAEFVGIGARLVEDQGAYRIGSVSPGGPAARSGEIQEDDRIIAVAQGTDDPVPVEGKALSEVAGMIKGEEGSEVRLTIEPAKNQVVKQKIIALRRSKLDVAAAKPESDSREPLDVGEEAPDITFTVIDGGKEQKLSDLKGKVRVIDFWATWCGPCQGPMAKMQTYAEKHPEFGDKVIFMSMSVDDNAKTAEKHLTNKGWNKTYNTWTSDGEAAKYRIFSIPQVYVVDAEGKIAARGHPASINIAETVKGLLEKKNDDPAN